MLATGVVAIACGNQHYTPAAPTTSAFSVAPATVAVNAADSGRRLHMTEGQTLVVRLETNPSSGYQWTPAPFNQAVLRQLGNPDYTPDPRAAAVPGGRGVTAFRFAADHPGRTQLTLNYRRPTEKSSLPAKTMILDVSVS